MPRSPSSPDSGSSAPRAGDLPPDGKWLSIQQACAILGVDQTTLRRWSDAGKIPVFRTPGGHRRYAEEHVRALLGDGMRKTERPRVSRHALANRSLSGYEPDFLAGARERRWFAAFDAGALDELRRMGRDLVDLAVRYAALPAGSADRPGLVSEGQRIGARYGRMAADKGLSVADTVEAFLYFRFPVVFAVTGMVDQQQMPAKRVARMFSDIHQFMDRVLLATVRAREEQASGGLPAENG